jgi:hypothetical protein
MAIVFMRANGRHKELQMNVSSVSNNEQCPNFLAEEGQSIFFQSKKIFEKSL